jgi:hypothetical protein
MMVLNPKTLTLDIVIVKIIDIRNCSEIICAACAGYF